MRGRQEARKGTDFSFLIFEKDGDVLVGGLTISTIRRRAAQYAISATGWARSSLAAA